MTGGIGIGAWLKTLGSWGRTVSAYLQAYLELRRERAQLLALTERQRRDIGITRLDAVSEARKPLWRDLRRRAQGRPDLVEEAHETGAPVLDAVMPERMLARGLADAPAPPGVLHELLHDAEQVTGKRAE